MTEKLQSLSTQIANPSQTVSPATQTITSQDVSQKVEPTVEGEEPYTIKCICGFSDDDGNTIYCETCDTWQHIECFYPNHVEDPGREEFAHSCHHCKPRPLDHHQAAERQRSRHTMTVVEAEATNLKPKRPPSKSHKKKPKPTDLHLNGHAPASETPTKHSIPHDHPPPAKKAKNTHRPSQSVSLQAAKRSPSYGTSRALPHGHPPSPATTPPDLPAEFEIHSYSPGFISHCKDQDVQIVGINSFANLMISNTMSLWLREPERMRQDTLREHKDVFVPLPANIDSLKQAPHVESKKLPVSPDTIVRWQYLTSPEPVEKDIPLMELNGQIGVQKDYCADPANRWEELTSPLPYVFFHPELPLYIDTRKEGSRARYVRRSCKPNAVLDTFLFGGSEYQFWLVSDRPISANEQITIPWDFRFPKEAKSRILRLLGLGDGDSGPHDEPELDDSEYASIASWLHLVLSEYGGCACGLGTNCAFVRFHRNYHVKMQTRSNPAPKKKSRKPKNNTISPTSTGQATNSRAASEGRQDDSLENDGRSTSGSSRSKPPSRDMTPARQGSFDTLGILTEPTDRDKRKVAMVEDSFRRLEQQPPRKKKRISDGTGNPGNPGNPGNSGNPGNPGPAKVKARNSTSQPSGLPNGMPERRYVDAGTARSTSGSPASAASPKTGSHPFGQSAPRPGPATVGSRHTSSTPHVNYCDAAVQTDPVEGEWYSEPGQAPKPRRRIVSLSKRLLDNRHRLRLDEEEKRKQRGPLAGQDTYSTVLVDVDAPISDQKVVTGPSSPTVDADKHTILAISSAGDVAMADAPATSPRAIKVTPITTSDVPDLTSPVKNKSPDLRVQMPPVPAFNNSSSALSATTPLSASSLVQSPFATSGSTPFGPPTVNGIAASPSPVKKKLSLSDYTKSRKAAASRPSVGTSLKPSSSNLDDPKSATSAEGAGAVDSPTAEKGADALTNATTSTTPPVGGCSV